MNCLRLQTEVTDSNKEGFSRKQKDAQFLSASAKAIWIKAAFLSFGLSRQRTQLDLRLKTEAIHKALVTEKSVKSGLRLRQSVKKWLGTEAIFKKEPIQMKTTPTLGPT
jgi:hypothetical protein